MKIIWKCVSPFLRFASPPRGPAAGLLALTVLVFAFAAQAEQVTFVSNTGQGAVADGYYTHTQYRAQQFTTGDHTAGYELSEIVVDIGKSCVIAPAFSLHKSSTDAQNLEVPGAKVIDLIGSASSQGRASFTPARATTLTRSTKYFVLFKAGAHAGTLDCKLRRTLSSNVDDGAASGWDIAGRAVFSPDSGSTWTNTGGGPEDPPPVIRIAIKGAFKSSRNTRVPQRVSAPAAGECSRRGKRGEPRCQLDRTRRNTLSGDLSGDHALRPAVPAGRERGLDRRAAGRDRYEHGHFRARHGEQLSGTRTGV